jgi:hypothetical protein
MSRNKGKFTWQGLLQLLTHIETDDPSIRRKGELLALFIGLCWGLLNYSVVNTAVVLILHPTYEYTIYLIEDLLVFIPLHIFWKMNQKGKVFLTANLAISFSILAGVFLSDAKYIEYLMVIFALPIGMSSFIIRPSSSFWYAGLTATGYTISSLISGYTWEYNLTAVMALFALAFMTWATANQLERTLKRNQTLVDTLKKSNSEIQAAYETTLEGWSRALEVRDRETQGHSKRVTELTIRIARRMGFSEDMLVHIYRGALLHDIGKLGIPDDILHKKGPLTEQEMRIMRLHPQIALDLLSPIDYLKPALNIPRYHHEKWDGTGYPHGLSGETIPLEARIYAIVDVFDALTHDRPYRAAMPTHEALEYIKSEAGKQFDPEVVRVFLSEINNREN